MGLYTLPSKGIIFTDDSAREALMNKDVILIVDDEPSVLSSLYRSLRSEPWEIMTELSGEQALVRMGERPVKVLISDQRMPKMQGSELLSTTQLLYPHTVRILLTGHSSLEASTNAINYGEVFSYLTKPWNDEDLKQVIREALNKYDREQEVISVLKRLEDRSELLSDIVIKFPDISQFIQDKHRAALLTDMSVDQLEEVLRLLEHLGKSD